jgi:uncharacterized protein
MSPKYIVIDTNIFISAALSPNGTANQSVTKAIQEFTIVHSDKIYQEIADRLYKPKFDKYLSNERRTQFLNLIHSKSQFIKTISQIVVCRDLDDNKFLELAIDSNAKFLVTGDKDLLILKSQSEYQHIIVSARDFLDID